MSTFAPLPTGSCLPARRQLASILRCREAWSSSSRRARTCHQPWQVQGSASFTSAWSWTPRRTTFVTVCALRWPWTWTASCKSSLLCARFVGRFRRHGKSISPPARCSSSPLQHPLRPHTSVSLRPNPCLDPIHVLCQLWPYGVVASRPDSCESRRRHRDLDEPRCQSAQPRPQAVDGWSRRALC